MKIDGTEFGKTVVDGKTYEYDITIDANGKVAKRSDISKAYYDTGHVICTEEIKKLLETKPEIIVIGTGQYGKCRLEEGVSRTCERNKVRLIVEPTPKAIKSFNDAVGKKAGLFHLTC